MRFPSPSSRHSTRFECRDGALDFAGVTHVKRTQLHPQRRRHDLDSAELPGPGGDGRIPKDCHSLHMGSDLFEQLQPFSAHAVFVNREPNRVATRRCQARDETGTDRIDTVTNTIGTVRVACSNGATIGVPVPAMSTSGASAANSAASLKNVVGRGPTSVDPDVAAFASAQLLHGLCERREAGLSFCIVLGQIHEHADASHGLALLRARGDWPCYRRAAEHCDELEPLHAAPTPGAS